MSGSDPDPNWTPFEPAPWPGDAARDDDKYESISEKEKSSAQAERFARIATTVLLGTLLVIALAFVIVVATKGLIWMASL